MSWQGIHGPVHLLVPVAAAPRLRQWGPKRGANPKQAKPTGPPPLRRLLSSVLQRCRQPWGLGQPEPEPESARAARSQSAARFQPFRIWFWQRSTWPRLGNFQFSKNFPLDRRPPDHHLPAVPPSRLSPLRLPDPITKPTGSLPRPLLLFHRRCPCSALSVLVFDTRLGRAPSADFLRTLVAPPCSPLLIPASTTAAAATPARPALPSRSNPPVALPSDLRDDIGELPFPPRLHQPLC